MSDIKLFRTTGEEVTELVGSSVALEKSLQALFEANLEALLGVRFLATEYSTGKTHGGRIDWATSNNYLKERALDETGDGALQAQRGERALRNSLSLRNT